MFAHFKFNLNARMLPAGLTLVLMALTATVWATPTMARSSRDDLVAQMLDSLEQELPKNIKGIAIMQFTNGCNAPLDINLLREDLEVELINSPRFYFINRSLLDATLKEIGMCRGRECFMDPTTLQELGKAKGIDAMLIGEVINSSTKYKDYYTTVILQAISTSTACVVWQKEIMGVNTANVVDVLGGLPSEQAVTREEALGREVARFLGQSTKLKTKNIRTVSILDFENPGGRSVDMDALFRSLTNHIVSETDLKLMDRKYMEEYLKAQELWFGRLTEASQRKNIDNLYGIGKLYGIDAFICGTIREVTDDKIVCVVRINDIEANVDIDARNLTAAAENMEWYLPNMLSKVGPSIFTSEPSGAEVLVDGQRVGVSPCKYQLSSGTHTVQYGLHDYESKSEQVVCENGRGQKVHVKLDRAISVVSFLVRPFGTDLVINGKAEGSSPLVGLELPYGDYKVQAERPMFEKMSRTLTVDSPSHEFTLELMPKSKSKAIMYSLLFPGSGQRYKGQYGKGWAFTLGVIGSAGFAVMNEISRSNAVDDYNEAHDAYLAAINQTEMDRQFVIMQDKLSKADDKASARDLGWTVCGGLWVLNVIDAALGWPAAEAGVSVGMVPQDIGGQGFAVTVGR